MNASAVVFISLLLLAVAALILLGVRLALSARPVFTGSEEPPESEPTKIRQAILLTAVAVLVLGGLVIAVITAYSAAVRKARIKQERSDCLKALFQVRRALESYHNRYDAFPHSMQDMAVAAAKAAANGGLESATSAHRLAEFVLSGSWPLPSTCPAHPEVRYLYVGGVNVRSADSKVLVVEEKAVHGGKAHVIVGWERAREGLGKAVVRRLTREEIERFLEEWRQQAPAGENGSW